MVFESVSWLTVRQAHRPHTVAEPAELFLPVAEPAEAMSQMQKTSLAEK